MIGHQVRVVLLHFDTEVIDDGRSQVEHSTELLLVEQVLNEVDDTVTFS